MTAGILKPVKAILYCGAVILLQTLGDRVTPAQAAAFVLCALAAGEIVEGLLT